GWSSAREWHRRGALGDVERRERAWPLGHENAPHRRSLWVREPEVEPEQSDVPARGWFRADRAQLSGRDLRQSVGTAVLERAGRYLRFSQRVSQQARKCREEREDQWRRSDLGHLRRRRRHEGGVESQTSQRGSERLVLQR